MKMIMNTVNTSIRVPILNPLRAAPGFFVGGCQKMGAIWPLGPQMALKYVLQLGTVVIGNFPIKPQYFDPKNGVFSYRGGGQGTLAPCLDPPLTDTI